MMHYLGIKLQVCRLYLSTYSNMRPHLLRFYAVTTFPFVHVRTQFSTQFISTA